MYQNYQSYPYYQQRPNRLPPQHALKVNGKASIDMLQMSPDSDALIMDTSAPRIWYCVSDSLGNITAKSYKVIEEEDEPNSIEERLAKIESVLTEMEGRINESHVKEPTIIEYPPYQGYNERG